MATIHPNRGRATDTIYRATQGAAILFFDGNLPEAIEAATEALAMLYASSLKAGTDVDSFSAMIGAHLAKRIVDLEAIVKLDQNVDLMNATIRKAKGLPISEEEEAALYHISVIDKDGKLTPQGVLAAASAKDMLGNRR